MKPEQFSHRIGNIDDKLVQQAENTPNYRRRHRNQGIRRMVSAAAVLALMVCSFAAGAFAFAKEPEIIYVEKEQEIITIGDSGISLILPDEWAGKYGYDADGNNIAVYQLATHEKSGDWGGAGYLFWISCLDGLYPMDYTYPQPGYTIATTAAQTYCLIRASDVQYDPSDEAVAEEYLSMSGSISQIQILLTDWMTDNSTNATNWIPGTVYISYLEDWEVIETVVCDEEASQRIAEIIKSQDYSLEQGGFFGDLWIMLDGEEYYMNVTTGSIANAAGHPYSAVLSAEDLQEFMELLSSQTE